MEKTNKISSVEGIRGFSAVVVALHHFTLMFYPAIYFSENTTLCEEIEIVIGQTPLGFLTVGNSAVMAFLMITGFGTYVLSKTASEEKKQVFGCYVLSKCLL